MLRVAKRLKVITTLPVENFDLLKVPEVAVPPFYTFEEYAALVPPPSGSIRVLWLPFSSVATLGSGPVR